MSQNNAITAFRSFGITGRLILLWFLSFLSTTYKQWRWGAMNDFPLEVSPGAKFEENMRSSVFKNWKASFPQFHCPLKNGQGGMETVFWGARCSPHCAELCTMEGLCTEYARTVNLFHKNHQGCVSSTVCELLPFFGIQSLKGCGFEFRGKEFN